MTVIHSWRSILNALYPRLSSETVTKLLNSNRNFNLILLFGSINYFYQTRYLVPRVQCGRCDLVVWMSEYYLVLIIFFLIYFWVLNPKVYYCVHLKFSNLATSRVSFCFVFVCVRVCIWKICLMIILKLNEIILILGTLLCKASHICSRFLEFI